VSWILFLSAWGFQQSTILVCGAFKLTPGQSSCKSAGEAPLTIRRWAAVGQLAARLNAKTLPFDLRSEHAGTMAGKISGLPLYDMQFEAEEGIVRNFASGTGIAAAGSDAEGLSQSLFHAQNCLPNHLNTNFVTNPTPKAFSFLPQVFTSTKQLWRLNKL
jgi:hypothetical protein